jgi:hypothetical protein
LAVTLDLQAGDTVLLRIANNNASGASSFSLLETTVVFVPPSR